MDTSPHMSRDEAAKYLGLSMATLALDASKPKHGIPYSKIGRRVIYNRNALDAWIESRVVGGSKTPKSKGNK